MASKNQLKISGIAVVSAGVLLILMFPIVIYERAHQEALAYGAEHTEMRDGRYLELTNRSSGQPFLYRQGSDGALSLLQNGEIMEMDSLHVLRADKGRAKYLSGGYMSDFTRIPPWVFVVSCAMLIGGIRLVLIGSRKIETPQALP